jgi:hypothetical protein
MRWAGVRCNDMLTEVQCMERVGKAWFSNGLCGLRSSRCLMPRRDQSLPGLHVIELAHRSCVLEGVVTIHAQGGPTRGHGSATG